MIDEIFPGTNSYIPVRRSAQTQNNAFNLRVVASEMDQLSLDRAFEEMPDACAIASIPYSDPAIAPLLSGRDTESLLYRSLSLLAKNDRTTPSEIAKDLNGRLDTRIGNIQDIERVFDENPMSTLVFKVIGHRA